MTGCEVKISVYDARMISKRARKPFEKKTALISMRGTDEKRPFLCVKPDRSLFLVFDDTFPAEAELSEFRPLLFSEQMAVQTVKFIYSVWNNVDEIICQCECGMSRSAGMAAAIKEHFYGAGREILESKAYSPNMYVYGLMMEAFNKVTDTIPTDVPKKSRLSVYPVWKRG